MRRSARPLEAWFVLTPKSYAEYMKAIGAICDKTAVRYTVVGGNASPIDAEIAAPASKTSRGEVLNWLLEELEELLRKTSPVAVWVKKAGGGQFASSPERHEVEAVVQLAAHRTGVACQLKNTEQLRAAAGMAKGKGAYNLLLAREDVAARPSKDKRERYVYAHTALRIAHG